mgnify:FL=1
MAFADNLPINETLGVFVGVAGIDWLTDGQAEPIKAVAVAIATGAVILIARRWRKQRSKN